MRRKLSGYIACAVLLGLAGLLPGDGQTSGLAVNRWTRSADMQVPRAAGCSALLADGRLLIAGGESAAGPVRSAELYGADGSVTVASPMARGRIGAACVTLADGRVMVAGGSAGTAALRSIEIYDPSKDSWTSPTEMSVARSELTATLLPWGSVLLAGGDQNGVVEAYNPARGDVQVVGSLSSARTDFAVAVLADRKVIIAGGSAAGSTLASIDVYDADRGVVSPAGVMRTPRAKFAAAALPDGTVLFTGGVDAQGNVLASSEIYNPSSGESAAGPDLSAPRANHQAYWLPDNGAVLVAGGSNSDAQLGATEIFSPWTGSFALGHSMSDARLAQTAAVRRPGHLIVAGGRGANGFLASTEVFRFATVSPDKRDYAPGETATFTGTGWKPGEQVLLQVTAYPADAHATEFTGAAVADTMGRISVSGFHVDRSHLGRKFLLSAAGSESHAETTFTDADTTVVSIDPITGPANWTSTMDIAVTGSVVNTTVPGQTPTGAGTISFFADSGTHYTGNLDASGNFSVHFNSGTEVLSPGPVPHTITIQYGGGPCGADTCSASFGLKSYTAPSPAVPFQPVFTVTYSPNPPAVGPNTITIAAAKDASGVYPTGNVALAINLVTEPLKALVNGSVTYNYTFLSAGSRNIGVEYGGDNNFLDQGADQNSVPVNVLASSTTTVAVSNPASPIPGGVKPTYTATVTPAGAGGTAITGTVTFQDNGTGIPNCSGASAVALSAGTASCAVTTAPAAGSHQITAVYSGDGNYSGSTSAAYSLTVQSAPVFTLTYSPNPPTVGPNTITITAQQVNGIYPTGNVALSINLVTEPPKALVNGSVTYTYTFLTAGSRNIGVEYGGDSNFLDQGADQNGVPVDVLKSSTTTVVASNPASPVGSGVKPTYTATVTPAGVGGTAMTGTVTFLDNGTAIPNCSGASAVALSAGSASCAVTTAPGLGSHQITAVYSGDGNYSGSTSAAYSLAVNTAPVFTLTYSPNPPTVGPNTITITAQQANGVYPTGNVALSINLVTEPLKALVNGSVTYNYTFLSAGSRNIGVEYGGDNNFLDQGADQNGVPVSVLKSATTTVAVSNPTSPIGSGVKPTYTATLTPAGAGTAMTGTVSFQDNGTDIPNCSGASAIALSAGAASCAAATAPALGTHQITAVYSGDGNYFGSTSAAYSLMVGSATVAGTPQSSAGNSFPYGTLTNISVTVSPNPATPAYTGNVQFKDGSTLIGQAVPNSTTGMASLTNVPLSTGSHTITAQYAGDANYGQSAASATLTIAVSKASTTATLTSNHNPSFTGQATTFTLTLIPQISGTPTGTVTFAADGVAVTPSVSLSSGSASFTTAALPSGVHAITAVWNGDGNFNTPGTIAPVNQQVFAFFDGEVTVSGEIKYLAFPNGNIFGYYTKTNFPWVYHYDLGFEYCIEANDGGGGAYMWDSASGHWFYTARTTFPYIYDFQLQTWLYYFPDTKNPGHYLSSPRSFANLTTGQIFTM